MRPFVAIALAILMAGCTTGTDDPAPPSDGTSGQATTPPLQTTSAPTGTPSPTYASSPTSAPSSDVTLSAPHQEDTATDARFSGLVVAGQLDVTGNVAHVEASANNIGERTYRVSSVCVAPWSEAMTGPSGATQHREPQATCAAFGLRDFPPGESIAFSAEWNGTVWTNAGGGGYVPAPAGTYRWSAQVQVYSGGSGASYDQSGTLVLEFEVAVA